MIHHSTLRTLRAKRRQAGQFSIELAIAVAIAALILAGIIYFLTQGRHNSQVNQEASSVTSIVGATQKLYNNDPTGYTNVTAAALINNGVIPTPEVQGTTIVSSFGTPITVAPDTLYNANDSVSFTYGIPPSMCSDFVVSVAPDFAKITVGGTAVKDTTAGTALAAATLGTQCSATAGANVAVVMTATR